ncbi:MAG: FkbM family methyltransferase [Lachnospiraceae bacterium]|nr:FkbM family methyltransferase [Lachnospiraceae bacterium]
MKRNKERVIWLVSILRRIVHIIHLFGLVGGLKYIWYYKKAKAESELTNSGKTIKLRYGHRDLLVRTNSTDLLLVESILVGRFIDRKWIGEYCQIDDFMKRLSTKSPIIIDAGANIGLFSRLILRNYPDARIYAVEPESYNFKILKSNTRQYPVNCVWGGVWSHDCKLKVVSGDIGEWGFIVSEVEESDEAIKAISFDSIIKKYSLERIDLLKIDVEGSEYEIFNSENLDWLKICKAVVIETHDHIVKGTDEMVNRILLERGFKKSVYEENQLFVK